MIRARELLAVAQALKGNEARGRSSVNSSYYAAFGEATAYLGRFGYSSSGRSRHAAAWNFLKNGIVDSDRTRSATRRATADIGFRLKARRQKSDYVLHQTVSDRETREALKEAE